MPRGDAPGESPQGTPWGPRGKDAPGGRCPEGIPRGLPTNCLPVRAGPGGKRPLTLKFALTLFRLLARGLPRARLGLDAPGGRRALTCAYFIPFVLGSMPRGDVPGGPSGVERCPAGTCGARGDV